MASNELFKIDNQLCFALYSTSLATTKVYQTHLKPLGLTYPQYIVFLVLWENDGLTVSELGEKLFLDSGTLTPLLKKMEQLGWVLRERSKEDERQVLIYLTTAGKQMKQKAQKIPDHILCASSCSVTELKNLVKQIKKVRESFINNIET